MSCDNCLIYVCCAVATTLLLTCLFLNKAKNVQLKTTVDEKELRKGISEDDYMWLLFVRERLRKEEERDGERVYDGTLANMFTYNFLDECCTDADDSSISRAVFEKHLAQHNTAKGLDTTAVFNEHGLLAWQKALSENNGNESTALTDIVDMFYFRLPAQTFTGYWGFHPRAFEPTDRHSFLEFVAAFAATKSYDLVLTERGMHLFKQMHGHENVSDLEFGQYVAHIYAMEKK